MKTRIAGQPANDNLHDDDVFQHVETNGLRFSICVSISAEAAETTRGERNQGSEQSHQ